VQGISIFITEKTVVEMLQLLKTNINKLLAKPTKEEKKKEVAIYQNIMPL
jgi:hypothetical protein